MNKVKKIAFVLCEDRNYLPLALEPGDVPKIDGYFPNGEPGHYIYRGFIPLARKILDSIEKE